MPIVNGSFFCASNLIGGSSSAQNLITLENPADSNLQYIVKRVLVQGVVNAASTTPFLYHLKRTTALPTGGTTLTAQKRLTSDADPTAVVRQIPTVTGATGNIWVGSPGVVLSGGLLGGPVSVPITLAEIVKTDLEDDSPMLAPGEAFLVSVDANTSSWNHYVILYWLEVQ